MNAPFWTGAKIAYQQLTNTYDKETRTLWSFMRPAGRPCFNIEMLEEMATFERTLQVNQGHYLTIEGIEKIDYIVLGSEVPGIFNLGGDLATFANKIQARDRETLLHYAHRCIDVIWGRVCHYGSNVTSIALVQGQALGGGFESALSADIIVAEEGSTLGLPEILFNLFPGMGALSLLARRIGMVKAEQLIMSGETYSAEELFEMGVVTVLAKRGEGIAAVNKWISRNAKHRNGYLAVQKSKDQISPITHRELIEITEIWVDHAMNLTKRDLRMMGHLVAAQNKVTQRAPEPEAELECA